MSKRVPPPPLSRFDTDQGLRGTLDAEAASQLVQGPANEGVRSVTFLDNIVLGVVEGFPRSSQFHPQGIYSCEPAAGSA
jgi:hypothetical protein